MADCALNRLAGAAGPHEGLSLGDATGRNVSQKGGVRIAIRCSEWILGCFDYAMADRFRAAVRIQKTMARRAADVRFRWRSGFDNLHPGYRVDCREIVRRLPHIFIGYILGNRTHALVVS